MNTLRKALSPVKRKMSVVFSEATKSLCGKYTSGFLVDCGELLYLVDVRDMSVGGHLRRNGGYGERELQIIDRLVTVNDHVVFVGTHVGALALPTARKVKRAVLVEANPNTFKLLDFNVRINRIDNVEIHNFAIGESQGSLDFLLSTVNSGGSKRVPVIKEEMYYYDRPETVAVPMRTLDSLLSGRFEDIALIVMDIEGSEFFAIKGMPDALARTRHLIMEFIPHHLSSVAGITADELLGELKKYFNYCFIPSKNKSINASEFNNWFKGMIERNEYDDGVVFSKVELKNL
jgi:FkbM family methyltransferase